MKVVGIIGVLFLLTVVALSFSDFVSEGSEDEIKRGKQMIADAQPGDLLISHINLELNSAVSSPIWVFDAIVVEPANSAGEIAIQSKNGPANYPDMVDAEELGKYYKLITTADPIYDEAVISSLLRCRPETVGEDNYSLAQQRLRAALERVE